MKNKITIFFSLLIIILVLALVAPSKAGAAPSDTIKMVPFHQVNMNDQIWRPRIRVLVTNTLPHAFENTRGAQESLRLCAEYLENGGGPKPQHVDDR